MQGHCTDVLVVSLVIFALATVFVALRFFSRIFIVRKLALHDYLMLLAWVCFPCSKEANSCRMDRLTASPIGDRLRLLVFPLLRHQ